MTIQHLYPTTRPSLDLNFARQKRLDPRVTFTRGSTATYVGSDGLIKTAASNEARFDHDPVTGESLGLLMETSRTNLVTYSEDFTNSYWSNSSFVTANTDVAPDGTVTADTYSSTGNQIQTSFIPITSNKNYTGSIYIKKTTGRTYTAGVLLNYDGGVPYGILLNTNDGTTSSAGYTLPTVAVSSVGNFWRISLTANSSSTVNVRLLVYPNMNSNAAVATGQQVIWGAQVEAGSFPTSYIPTSGSTVTRSDDLASMTGTNFTSWFNHTESTMYTEGVFIGDPYNGEYGYLSTFDVGVNDGSFYSRIRIGDFNDAITFQSTLPSPGSTTGNIYILIGANAKNTVIKQVHAITNAVSASAAVNGNLGTNTISGSIQVPDRLQLGRHGQAYKTTCHLRRFAYYPTRLTDTQLQALTL